MSSDTTTKRLIAAALDGMPPPSEAFERLASALQGDDEHLSATVRAMAPLIGLGILAMDWQRQKAATKKRRGRPRKDDLSGVDCWRAYRCWAVVNSLSTSRDIDKRTVSSREAIRLVRQVDEHLAVPLQERAFPTSITDASAEQSVARGKRALGMTEDWQSDHCGQVARMA